MKNFERLCFTLSFVIFFSFVNYSNAFSGIFICLSLLYNSLFKVFILECSNSGLADPNITGVTDCLTWLSYLISTGQNLQVYIIICIFIDF
jgi:hypothetical protein